MEREDVDTEQMAKMVREAAADDPGEHPGTGTLPSTGEATDGQHGMSQSGGVTSGQPLDVQMMQQAHQPRQGKDGGHAGSDVSDDTNE